MTIKPTIAVIGAGKWGQALHYALSQNQKTFITSRTPRDIKNFIDLDTALNCDYLIIAIPAQQLKLWLKENFIFKNQKVLVASKGIEANTGEFLNEIYADYVPSSNIGFISGPSFAAEVIQGLPCALVLNSTSKKLYDEFSPFFPTFIKTYYSSDVKCCGFAGDRGFNFPELNESALRDLPKSIKNAKYAFSTSKTCEIGLSEYSGLDYNSIFYLINKCTKAKNI